MTEHVYLSTGCLHGEHAYCQSTHGQAGLKTPAQCKFCQAACTCHCHNTTPGWCLPCPGHEFDSHQPAMTFGAEAEKVNDPAGRQVIEQILLADWTAEYGGPPAQPRFHVWYAVRNDRKIVVLMEADATR